MARIHPNWSFAAVSLLNVNNMKIEEYDVCYTFGNGIITPKSFGIVSGMNEEKIKMVNDYLIYTVVWIDKLIESLYDKYGLEEKKEQKIMW